MSAPTAAELAVVPFLAALSPAELQTAAQLFSVRSYPKGAIVATEGDRVDVFHLILSGRIKYFRRDEVGRQFDIGVNEAAGRRVLLVDPDPQGNATIARTWTSARSGGSSTGSARRARWWDGSRGRLHPIGSGRFTVLHASPRQL